MPCHVANRQVTSRYVGQSWPGSMVPDAVIGASGDTLCGIENIRNMSVHECVVFKRSGEVISWWRHQMEKFSALLALCAGNSPVPVTSPHKGQWRGALMISLICAWITVEYTQSLGWWFETPYWPLWRYCNVKMSLYQYTNTDGKMVSRCFMVASLSWTGCSACKTGAWLAMWIPIIRM